MRRIGTGWPFSLAARGVALIIAAVFVMSLQDAVVKLVSADLPLWQLYVLRSLLALPLLVLTSLGNLRRLRPRSFGWATLRGGLLVAMYVAFYAALPVLALSTVAAAYYTGPLFIVLLAALTLGERLGRREILAVLIGFAGVLVIVQPGAEAFSPLTLLPVGAALLYAIANVLTRKRCLDESPIALSVALNLVFILWGGAMTVGLAIAAPSAETVALNPFLLGAWRALDAGDWTVIGGLAVATVLIHLALAAAYQAAPAQRIASFDYCYLLFAVVWGLTLFGETPTPTTLVGMVLIAGAGLLVLFGVQEHARSLESAQRALERRRGAPTSEEQR